MPPKTDFITKADAQNANLFGAEPLPNMAYLLAPLTDTFAPQAALSGPSLVGDFTLLVQKERAAWTADDIAQAWQAWGDWQAKAALGFPKIWVQVNSNWEPLTGELPRDKAGRLAKVVGIALSWELSALLSARAADEAQELARNLKAAQSRVAPHAWTLISTETPETAAHRAQRLMKWKARFSQSVELRLVPQKTPFWSQTVWRCAYAVGMEWTQPFGGEARTRFVWPAQAVGVPRFFVGTHEAHGLLTPEKASGRETVPGLVFYFELPSSPAPLEIFDRMVLALHYFAQMLNGRAVTRSGAELDGEALDTLREQLEKTVQEMSDLGLAPGSPEAARFF